jgi:Protein of unknown function (DUF4038)/Putative collagen-binding domain of a collagenase
MQKFNLILFFSLVFGSVFSQQIKGPLAIHPGNKYLMTSAGEPFFWMADTAWELFHRCDAEETAFYLDKRKSQGFNVIQAVVLSELDGINEPNANGDKPFLSLEKWEYNEAYFSHVDKVIQMALERGIYIALLPTWGDKLFKDSWGMGPEIFTTKTAYSYGKWIGNRYKDQPNVIWVLGGDRNPRENSEDVKVWNEMARGIEESQNPDNRQLITFHPQPTSPGGSSNWFHREKWLNFNMHQTGHCPDQPTYKKISHDLSLSPAKPTIDGEPMYEEHPKCFNAKEFGYSEATDIRKIMYWNVFAGAAGQTYGCHAVWQMYDLDKTPVNSPLKPWQLSLDLEVANQVKHLKNLMLSQEYFSRISDQTLIADSQKDDEFYVAATRDESGNFAMFYFPTGKKTNLNLTALNGEKLTGKWFDPRTGVSFPMEASFSNGPNVNITPPSEGKGNDWVLILESGD